MNTPKVLSFDAFSALKAKADNYDSVVELLVTKNEGITAADVTLDTIREVMNSEGVEVDETLSARITELEGTVGTLNSTITGLTTERDGLIAEVDELKNLPGAESVTEVIPASEASAVVSDEMLEFAEKNVGDTAAIAAKLIETGFLQK